MQSERLLILSDGKPGHLNQSLAFARHLGCEYDICQVAFRSRLAKAASYLADWLHLCLPALFAADKVVGQYRAVVSTGSETYYANRVLASRLGCKSVAIMLPQGYRYNFDLIVAQEHDGPPQRRNLVSLPVNLSYAEPQGLVSPEPDKRYVALLIGGDSKHAELDPDYLKRQIEQIFVQFPDHDFWLTTSRRTPVSVENVLRQFSFAHAVYFSQEPINPISDYMKHSEYVFLTADSTSMISEAVSSGDACIEVLPFKEGAPTSGKLAKMLAVLERMEALHLFNDSPGQARVKIKVGELLRGVEL